MSADLCYQMEMARENWDFSVCILRERIGTKNMRP